tara:strand:+ start:320 stop:445 length:126 start_codon:yes stop_codon:yes gene_type:complete
MLSKSYQKLLKLNVKAQKAKTHEKAVKILEKHKKLSLINDH